MRRRIAVVAAVMAACLAMPAMPAGAVQPSTAGATLETAVSTPSAAVLTATRKPRASLSATLGLSATGRPQVRATSNAKKIRVAYRTAKGAKRVVTKKSPQGPGDGHAAHRCEVDPCAGKGDCSAGCQPVGRGGSTDRRLPGHASPSSRLRHSWHLSPRHYPW